MDNVSVVVDGRRILDGVNWQVLPGENWIVLGDNGAGKSTLLKLITSEMSPYADGEAGVGSIARLGGLTMDEARPLIGVVSPDLQAGYGRELGWEVTAEETVMSGYRGGGRDAGRTHQRRKAGRGPVAGGSGARRPRLTPVAEYVLRPAAAGFSGARNGPGTKAPAVGRAFFRAGRGFEGRYAGRDHEAGRRKVRR